MDTSEQIDRLVAEVLEIIPSFTSGWGSFNTFPQLGYTARNPGEWQREFLDTVDGQYLTAFKPDTNDIVILVELVNYWTLVHVPSPTFPRHDGTPLLTPVRMLSTIVGYALFEMLARKLGPGRLGGGSLRNVLTGLERGSSCPDLVKDLKSLNTKMKYKEAGRNLDLYDRLKKGRDQLMHGNVLRTFEPEGWLLVLLIDLIVLDVMRQEISRHNAASS